MFVTPSFQDPGSQANPGNRIFDENTTILYRGKYNNINLIMASVNNIILNGILYNQKGFYIYFPGSFEMWLHITIVIRKLEVFNGTIGVGDVIIQGNINRINEAHGFNGNPNWLQQRPSDGNQNCIITCNINVKPNNMSNPSIIFFPGIDQAYTGNVQTYINIEGYEPWAKTSPNDYNTLVYGPNLEIAANLI